MRSQRVRLQKFLRHRKTLKPPDPMVYQLGYSNNAMEYFYHFYMIYSTRVGHHKGSLNHGKWKESYLMPFSIGKCDRSCPNNYRGLALGNVVYKIYTSILRKRLCNWANYKNLIPPANMVFFPGKTPFRQLTT